VRIEAIRLRKAGWSQPEISKALAVPQPTIHLWITNNHDATSLYQHTIPNKLGGAYIIKNGTPITLFPCKGGA